VLKIFFGVADGVADGVAAGERDRDRSEFLRKSGLSRPSSADTAVQLARRLLLRESWLEPVFS
jgi:hypothetical protein